MAKLSIKVGLGSCGQAAGANEVYEALENYLSANRIEAQLLKTSCIGMCFLEPLVEISAEGKDKITFGEVTPEEVEKMKIRIRASDIEHANFEIVGKIDLSKIPKK